MKFVKVLMILIITVILFSMIIQFEKRSDSVEKMSIDSETDNSVSLSVNDIQISQNDLNVELQEEKLYDKMKSLYDDQDCVDDEVYKLIAEIYRGIDFHGEFEKGNIELYEFYKKMFLKIIKCETKFYDDSSQKEFYIDEFEEMDFSFGGCNTYLGYKATYDARNYLYYFFDMDGDDTPELCVSDGDARFIYIIKYDRDLDKFILWHGIGPSSTHLLGSQKLFQFHAGTATTWSFYSLDKKGNYEYVVRFYCEQYYNTKKKEIEYAYMVKLPEFIDKGNSFILTEHMKSQTINNESEELYDYFRVTEDQWNELTGSYFEARTLATEEIEKVSFTYDDLFGSFK